MSRQRRRRLIKARRTATGVALVAAISFLAGLTDAIGFLLSGNFVSFMTGNTTRAAIALGDGNLEQAAVLLLAIALFIAGNATGVVVAHFASRSVHAVLLAVGTLLAAAALSFDVPLLQFALTVTAMGMVNAAVERIEGLSVGLTYVTGALSRFGRGIGGWLIGDRKLDWTIQIVPWTGMLSGAIIGVLLATTLQSNALWVASGLTLCLSLAAFLIPRPLQRRFNGRHVPRPASQLKTTTASTIP